MAFTTSDLLNAVSVLNDPQGVIAFPTDTVYGLGCLPTAPQAIERIYTLKGRDETKPLILMSLWPEALLPYVGDLTPAQEKTMNRLMEAYWPGALTMVVPSNPALVPPQLTRGLKTVGIRVPNLPQLQALFSMIPGGALATTSANRSGAPDNRTAQSVIQSFEVDLPSVLAFDSLVAGSPSTVVEIEALGGVRILRQGALVVD